MFDQLDDRGVPQSKGIPSVVRLTAVIGIIAIFCVGGSVIWNSGYGHLWPADHVQRVDLSGK